MPATPEAVPRSRLAKPPRRLRRAGARLSLAAACHAAVLAGPSSAALAQPQGKRATTQLIQRGSALFDDQQYEDSLQMLLAALVRPGATEQERREIYRLLAYNYIILKHDEEADAAVRHVLVLDEGFSLPPTESPRFRDFFAKVKQKWIDEGKPGRSTAAAPVVEKPIHMLHSSPAEVPAGSTVKLSGTIEDPDSHVRGVQLTYRPGSRAAWVSVAASYTLGEFHTNIPGTAVKPPLLEYYVVAVDKSGLPLVSRGDAALPLRIVVPREGGVLTSPALWVPLGLAVVGGAIATAIILTRSSSQTSTVMVGVHE